MPALRVLPRVHRARVIQAGYRIHEVPITYNPRGILEGKKIKASDGFVAIYWLLKTWFSQQPGLGCRRWKARADGVPRGAPARGGSARLRTLLRRCSETIIQERPLMRAIYDLWYDALLEDAASVPQSAASLAALELGSGGSFLKERCAEVITSDLEPGIAERVIDGRELPFEDGSLRAIFLTHVFHHIPDVGRFLGEAERTLAPGGVISMIDIPHTPFARFVFDRFHPEPYVPDAEEWAFDQQDAMLDANQALAWMVFERDHARFAARFPGLVLERKRWLPWFSYLLSGGVTRRNLVPDTMVPLIRSCDRLLRPIDAMMALHWHVTIRRRDARPS